MGIGNNIRKERKLKGLTMKELGHELGISEQAISQYERNIRTPNTKTLLKIAKILNISVYELDSSLKELFQKFDEVIDVESLKKDVKSIELFEGLLTNYGYNFRMFSYGEEGPTNEGPIYEIYLTPKESIELTVSQYEELRKEVKEFIEFKLHRFRKAKK